MNVFRKEPPRDLDFLPSNQHHPDVPMREVLRRADMARDLDQQIETGPRLREIVTAAEKEPRAAANELAQGIEAMRAHLEKRRKLLISAIDEHEKHCQRAGEALRIMVENVAKVNAAFADAMRPTPINPETPPHDEGDELTRDITEAVMRSHSS